MQFDTYNFSFASFWLADVGAPATAAATAAAAADDAIDVLPSLIFGVGLMAWQKKSKQQNKMKIFVSI